MKTAIQVFSDRKIRRWGVFFELLPFEMIQYLCLSVSTDSKGQQRKKCSTLLSVLLFKLKLAESLSRYFNCFKNKMC